MTQYQMLKKLAECKAKLEFVEREMNDIFKYFTTMLYEVKIDLGELEKNLKRTKRALSSDCLGKDNN